MAFHVNRPCDEHDDGDSGGAVRSASDNGEGEWGLHSHNVTQRNGTVTHHGCGGAMLCRIASFLTLGGLIGVGFTIVKRGLEFGVVGSWC